jgi:hypothetical protein
MQMVGMIYRVVGELLVTRRSASEKRIGNAAVFPPALATTLS